MLKVIIKKTIFSGNFNHLIDDIFLVINTKHISFSIMFQCEVSV